MTTDKKLRELKDTLDATWRAYVEEDIKKLAPSGLRLRAELLKYATKLNEGELPIETLQQERESQIVSYTQTIVKQGFIVRKLQSQLASLERVREAANDVICKATSMFLDNDRIVWDEDGEPISILTEPEKAFHVAFAEYRDRYGHPVDRHEREHPRETT